MGVAYVRPWLYAGRNEGKRVEAEKPFPHVEHRKSRRGL